MADRRDLGVLAAGLGIGAVLTGCMAYYTSKEKASKETAVVTKTETTASEEKKKRVAEIKATRKTGLRKDSDLGVPAHAVSDAPIYRFVLTGGPCGGKSTALVEVADRLRSLGYQVFTVPELATIFHRSAVHFPADLGFRARIGWDAAKLKAQLSLENAYAEFAKNTNKPTVIISDRGAMDTKAYMEESHFESMLDMMDMDVVTLRDMRYDAVCHLMTSAIGAPKFYNTTNNNARRESVEEAADIDKRTRHAWLGHPMFRIIDNSTDFKNKVRRVIEFFSEYLNAPVPHSACRRFYVEITSPSGQLPEELRSLRCRLTSTFLKQSNKDQRDIVLRKRGQDGKYTYCVSVVQYKLGNDKDVYTRQKIIDSNQYISMLSQADISKTPVRRSRYCFEHEGQYFELDKWDGVCPLSESVDWANIGGNRGILIAESDSEEIDFPPFVKVIREITEEYSLKKLSRKVAV